MILSFGAAKFEYDQLEILCGLLLGRGPNCGNFHAMTILASFAGDF